MSQPPFPPQPPRPPQGPPPQGWHPQQQPPQPYRPAGPPPQGVYAGQPGSPGGPLMRFKSHVSGRNADVTVWPNRIEWSGGGLSNRKHQDMMLMRSVAGVRTKKGMLNSEVLVTGPSGVIAFKCSNAEAERFKQLVLSLMG